jgi:hypothetical protein
MEGVPIRSNATEGRCFDLSELKRLVHDGGAREMGRQMATNRYAR